MKRWLCPGFEVALGRVIFVLCSGLGFTLYHEAGSLYYAVTAAGLLLASFAMPPSWIKRLADSISALF
jgi:hypothetical protein